MEYNNFIRIYLLVIPSIAHRGVFPKCGTKCSNLLRNPFHVGIAGLRESRVVHALECVWRVEGEHLKRLQ